MKLTDAGRFFLCQLDGKEAKGSHMNLLENTIVLPIIEKRALSIYANHFVYFLSLGELFVDSTVLLRR